MPTKSRRKLELTPAQIEAQQRAAEELKLQELWVRCAVARGQLHQTLLFTKTIAELNHLGLSGDGLSLAMETAVAELDLEIRAYVDTFTAADKLELSMVPPEEQPPVDDPTVPAITQPGGVA